MLDEDGETIQDADILLSASLVEMREWIERLLGAS